jgi:hypothetical protein
MQLSHVFALGTHIHALATGLPSRGKQIRMSSLGPAAGRCAGDSVAAAKSCCNVDERITTYLDVLETCSAHRCSFSKLGELGESFAVNWDVPGIEVRRSCLRSERRCRRRSPAGAVVMGQGGTRLIRSVLTFCSERTSELPEPIGPSESLYFVCRDVAPLVPRVAVARSYKGKNPIFLTGGSCALGYRTSTSRTGTSPSDVSVLASLAALGYACVNSL